MILSQLLLCLLLQDPPLFPAPATQPRPDATDNITTITLAQDEWLIVGGSSQRLIVTLPRDGVTISETGQQSGQVSRFRGRFAGGGGKLETRSFSDPWVYSIEPGRAGTFDLLVIPVGVSEIAQIERVRLVVSGGGPQPPPDPSPKPPAPTPTPQPDVSEFRVLLLTDQSDSIDAQQAANSISVRQWLDANCVQVAGSPEWRRWDRSAVAAGISSAPAIWRKLWQDIQPELGDGPQAVICRGADVSIVNIETQEQLLAELRKAKAGQ